MSAGPAATVSGETPVEFTSVVSNAFVEITLSVLSHSCAPPSSTFLTPSHNPEVVTPCLAGTICTLS